MSETSLLQQLLDAPGAPLTNWREIVEEVNAEFARCTTSDCRVALPATFKATIDIAETTVVPEDLETFRQARLRHYKSFVVQEATIGGNVCVETLDAITQREVAAGRMAPSDSLREVAVASMAAPHLSRAELVAMEEAKQHDEQTPAARLTAGSWGQRLRAWVGRG
jgi:hypothetical protein